LPFNKPHINSRGNKLPPIGETMFPQKISYKKINHLTGSLLLITMVCSMVMSLPLAASDVPQGNNVSWQSQNDTTQNSWNWTNQGWQFGPYPTFSLILANGTIVTDDNYIPIGQVFTAQIDIQKNIFTGNATLGQAGLNWGTNIISQNGTITGNANCNMMYVNSMQQQGFNQTNTWQIFSNINNNTLSDVKSPNQPMPQSGFYQFNSQQSSITETAEGWRIQIVGFFNSSTPVSPYWVNLRITDQYNNGMDVNSQAAQNSQSNNRQVAVGQAGFVYGGYQEFWTFEKLDMENNPLLSISKGTEWKMRLNITSSDFQNATLGLCLPNGIQQYVNVTGWYQQVTTQHGGWMYNSDSGTYYWNSTVEVTRNEQVYGPHLEQRWINLPDNNHQFNVTDNQYNPVTNKNELTTHEINVQSQLMLIYNHQTNIFEMKKGYIYQSYDQTQQKYMQYQVLSPIDVSDAATQFFNLSIADCKYYQTAPNNHVVEFVGIFSNSTSCSMDQMGLQTYVFNSKGQIWTNWETTTQSDLQIIIDRPVAVSTLLDSQGKEVSAQNMFMIGQNKPFIVQSKIYGSSQMYQDLDGVGVSFNSNFGTWSANESSNSQVEIRLTKNLNTGQINSVSYNRTSVNRYVYGSHLGWTYVNVTDWHTEYNPETNTWDWVQSPHLIWNQTTLTDWHWEYYRLNQTAYAINPNSPNVWIDTTTCYVDDMDPAFIMQTSYATMNAANITLANGVVVVNLNVTFTPSAPQGNYWYNMLFQNSTYAQDNSQGWGQHQITEWTNEPVYYVNMGSGQTWYASTPTNPMSTTYEGEKYPVTQVPYITINGNNLLIKPQVQYDQGQQRDWTQYLLCGPYDPSLNRQTQYYELANGTDININQAYQAIIRTLLLNNNANAYVVVDGSNVALPSGVTIETYMNHAVADYSRQYWDGQNNVVPNYYEQLNGTRVYLNCQFEQAQFNSTTNHWDRSNKLYAETDHTLLVQSAGPGVTLSGSVVMLRSPGNWQMLPDNSGYYLVLQNGTRITLKDPWVQDNQRTVEVNGVSYLIGWPNQYYQAYYNGRTLLIPSSENNDNYVQSFFYTDLGVNGGSKYELPYPGAMATQWWDLQGLESTGQKLRTFKSISVDGTDYVLNLDSTSQTYYIEINGTRHTIPYPTVDYTNFYANINGQNYWNVTQNGWAITFGATSLLSNQLAASGTVITTTGYDITKKAWTGNRYGWGYENATYYLMMPNGTRLDVSSTMNLGIWKVQVGDRTYYTTDSNSIPESTTDPSTGQTIYRNYFTTLTGEKVYFDYNTSPASWQQEIHVPISGTNYTKLVPYNWQPQVAFDKVMLYNITIIEDPYNNGHTGVYYANGQEVPIGTQFKVFGTTYGPATTYRYSQDNSNSPITFLGAQVQMTNAPYANNSWVGYCVCLDGSLLYSQSCFGFNVGTSSWNSNKQWQYISDEDSSVKTIPVTLAGYAIYLDGTTRVPITTQYPCWSGTGNYVVLLNGTYLDIQQRTNDWRWTTTIGTQSYAFCGTTNYYSITDDGTTYYIADPLSGDQRGFLCHTFYQTPTVNSGDAVSIMTTTSASILHDTTGYYLADAQNHGRLDIQLVDDWWGSIPSTLRDQVFSSNLVSGYYPRFNVTIDGVEYFVLDPSPVTDRWNGDWSIQNSMYRYPSTIKVTLEGTTYAINLIQSNNWNSNLTIRQLNTIQIDGATYTLDDQNNWRPSYQVSTNGQTQDIQMDSMNIYKTHTSWGNTYKWMLTDMAISTSSKINCLIVGTPQYGMWGIKAYKTVETTGALDLDGDPTTVSDQYFVRKIHTGLDSQTQTTQRMMVNTDWNPDATKIGDDVKLNAWMGQLKISWTNQWNESYVWYRASDLKCVSNQEMNQITNVIINNATQKPNPGYWDLAYMVRNQTWQDILAQAQANNWDWINSNTNEWNWLWFGTDQNYNVNVQNGNTTNTAGVDLKYEFAGLNLLNGTDQTHYFMPKTVGNVSFVTPGQAYGNMATSGNMTLALGQKIDFGVAYDNVNGTLFPYSTDRSMWGWWDQPIYGSDFNAPNLMNKPTTASIDQLAFTVHFAANQTDSQYNAASMKIDQRIGDWSLPSDIVDGRAQNSSGVMVPLVGNQVLQDRSLSVNYYVTASTSLGWDVKNDQGTSISNNGVTNSSQFNLASQAANINFASVKLGSTYDWSKPTTSNDEIRTFNVTSQTTSIQNFQSSYQSGAGKSSTGFDISSSMYFLTQGFPHWDGYAIYNDPEVSVMLSKGTTPQATQQPSGNNGNNGGSNTQGTGSSGGSGTQGTGSSGGSGTQNTGTSNNNPTTKPSGNNNPTPQPKETKPTPTISQPTPNQTQPPAIPTVLILVGICVGLGIAGGAITLVRKKNH
jgi:hypothetical protein